MAHFLFSSVPSAGHRHTEPSLSRTQPGQGCWPLNEGCMPPRGWGKSWAQAGVVCWDERHPGSGRLSHSLINYNCGFVLKNDSFEISFHPTLTATEASDIQNGLQFLRVSIFIPGPDILFWSVSSLVSPFDPRFRAGVCLFGGWAGEGVCLCV